MRLSRDIDEVFEEVAPDDGGRIDAWLAGRIGKSRSFIARLIDEGAVSVNEEPVTKSHRVAAGESVRCIIYKEQVPDLTPREVPFEVVFETDRYVIINKPAGYSVHPAPTEPGPTIVHGLLARFSIDDDHDFRPGIVHRLDKDTSGLLLVAKDRDARERLAAMFAERGVRKFYLAVCKGEPGFTEKRIETLIDRHPVHRKKMAVVEEGGRKAVSIVRVKERLKGAFVAEVEILTGRTHQIRVHMAYTGHPILGDMVYGPKNGISAGISRQALHAMRLVFIDPFTGTETVAVGASPSDIRTLISRLKCDQDG